MSTGKKNTAEEPDYQAPIKPQILLGHKADRHGKAWTYYLSIAWDQYWDEFCNEQSANGNLKYKTAWAFIKAKTKRTQERNWMWEMIGPRPDQEDVPKRKTPWLGDWQRRRSLGFWALDDPTKVGAIQDALKERKTSFEAVQGLAPVIAQQIRKYVSLSQKADEAFGGKPFLDSEPPNSPKNLARFKSYMDVLKGINVELRQYCDDWMKVNGVSPSDAQQWVQMAMAMAMSAGAGAAAGSVLASNISQSHILLAQSIADKNELFPGLDTPQVTLEMPGSAAKVPVNGNGKKVN